MRKVLCKLLFVLAVVPLWAGAAGTRDGETYFFSLNMGDLKVELADARARGKQALLIMFEQEGCPACLYMKRYVLNRKNVQDLYRGHFVNLALDIHGSVPLKDFAGREVTEKAYAQSAKIIGTPTFVFYDFTGTEILRIAGAVETVDEFLLLGRFVASGAYNTRSFAQFKRETPAGR